MANSLSMLLALMTLIMQNAVIQSQTFENGTEDATTPVVREGFIVRLAKQWKMGVPIKLSEERKKDLTITEYNKLIREVVEDSDGSHVIDIGDYKPVQKLSSDRHYHVEEDGEINDEPISLLPEEMKPMPINMNSRLKQLQETLYAELAEQPVARARFQETETFHVLSPGTGTWKDCP